MRIYTTLSSIMTKGWSDQQHQQLKPTKTYETFNKTENNFAITPMREASGTPTRAENSLSSHRKSERHHLQSSRKASVSDYFGGSMNDKFKAKNSTFFGKKFSLNYNSQKREINRINEENKKIAANLLSQKASFDIVKVMNEQDEKT